MLIALQCHERGIVPEHVAGFHTWIKLGRVVRKGEKALRILAPITVNQRDRGSDEADERRVFFKTTFVFDTLSRDHRNWSVGFRGGYEAPSDVGEVGGHVVSGCARSEERSDERCA
jgi:hypothetical protein